MILGPEPASCVILYFLNRIEQVLGQPIVVDGSIVALDICILLWFAEFDKLQPDLAFLGPMLK